jgi:UPF0755 protein
MLKRLKKMIYGVIGVGLLVLVVAWFLVYRYTRDGGEVTVSVLPAETVRDVAVRLKTDRVIISETLFRAYARFSKLDRDLQAGTFTISEPASLARIAHALTEPQIRDEREITIIPGWSLRDIAEYFEKEGIASEEEVYALTGKPAEKKNGQVQFDAPIQLLSAKPSDISVEGYIAPNTYRIFVGELLTNTLERLISHREKEITPELVQKIKNSGRTFHEILTMASIVEREVPHESDMAKVADLFWRRVDAGWGLQADSTVHYATGKEGDVFTTATDRASENLWNTYKWKGLPPGPIATPSIEAIKATLSPEKNEAWFFLTTLDTGEVKYGKDLDEHNENVRKYLR